MRNNFAKDHNIIKCIVNDLIHFSNFQWRHLLEISHTNLETLPGTCAITLLRVHTNKQTNIHSFLVSTSYLFLSKIFIFKQMLLV